MHGKSNGKISHSNTICCIYTRKIISAKNIDAHYNSLFGSFSLVHTCDGCGKFISDRTKYCSASCRTTIANKHRPPKSQETKDKISEKVNISNALNIRKIYIAEYSKLYHNNCKKCKYFWIDQKSKKLCEKCSEKDSIKSLNRRNRSQFLFNFNILEYPDLFDISQIQLLGWYSPAKKTDRNLNGLTRDHIISVSAAIKNNYNPYYIRHPINCKIMTQSENSTKKTKSHLPYAKLKALVILYDKIRKCSTN
jgi:hypothetical protein